MDQNDRIRIKLSEAETLGLNALKANGVSEKNAAALVRVYLEAEKCGKGSHGLQLIPWVLKQLQETNPGEPKVLKETDSSIFMDGAENPGPPIAEQIIERLLQKTETQMIAIGGMRNAGHIGILSYYVKQLTDKGRIGLAFATTPSVTVPLGGKEPALGTNPVCIGAPMDGAPIIFDASTTAITYHSLLKAKNSHSKLPDNVVLDEKGTPTTDPDLADPTRLLPFGAHRGFGLSLMIEILTGALNGWKVGAEKAREIKNDRFSTTFVAIRSDVFVDQDDFVSRVKQLSKDVAKSQGRKDAEVPYAHSLRAKSQAERMGTIELPATVVNLLKDLARM